SVLGKDIHVATVEKVTDELSEARHAILVGSAGPAVADEQDVDLWRIDDRTAVVDEVAEGAGAAESCRLRWLARAAGTDDTHTYLRSRTYTHPASHLRVMSSVGPRRTSSIAGGAMIQAGAYIPRPRSHDRRLGDVGDVRALSPGSTPWDLTVADHA